MSTEKAFKLEPWGFVVIEFCDDYEQILALDVDPSFPPGGILIWAESGRKRMRVIFPTKKTARDAITRTEHYRLAFGRTDLPEKANCKVELIAYLREVNP